MPPLFTEVYRSISYMLLADADGGGEVIHRVDAVERASDRIRVAHVAAEQLDVGVKIRGPPGIGAVHLRRQIVERADAMSVPQQFVGEMRPDEAGAARDQDLHGDDSSFPLSLFGVGLAYERARCCDVSSKAGANRPPPLRTSEYGCTAICASARIAL